MSVIVNCQCCVTYEHDCLRLIIKRLKDRLMIKTARQKIEIFKVKLKTLYNNQKRYRQILIIKV